MSGTHTSINSQSILSGDKAAVLAALEGKIKHGLIGRQVCLSQNQWRLDKSTWLQVVAAEFPEGKLIIRSSHSQEDGSSFSQAGRFRSVSAVDAQDPLRIASSIDAVFASYPQIPQHHTERIFIQQYLADCQLVGVLLTQSLGSGAPYYQISYQHLPTSTDVVTAGGKGRILHHTCLRGCEALDVNLPPALLTVIQTAGELEAMTRCQALDIEFGIDQQGVVHVFQVRRLPRTKPANAGQTQALKQVIHGLAKAHFSVVEPPAGVVGRHAMLGIMPDWNPAEIIGVKPRPLALSLYRYLLLDGVWAMQRHEYGYRDMRGHSLLRSLAGCPYVDVRLSLNSLVPSVVSEPAARRIVDAGLAHLKLHPEWHDKLEFKVAVSVLTPAFKQAVDEQLRPHGVEDQDLDELFQGLRDITNGAMFRLHEDTHAVELLRSQRQLITASDRPILQQALSLLESAKNFGTLPFAHAARAAFVAMNLLNDFVRVGFMSQTEKEAFLMGLDTVSAQFRTASNTKTMAELVSEYGHLRPGSYDITSRAYWEMDEHFWAKNSSPATSGDHEQPPSPPSWALMAGSQRAIEKWLSVTFAGLPLASWSASRLFDFFRQAIVLREQLKFEFSRNLSMALDRFIEWGKKHQLDRDSLSFLTGSDWCQLADQAIHADELAFRIKHQQKQHQITLRIELPPLITEAVDFFGFNMPESTPNYVTKQMIEAPLLSHWQRPEEINSCVVLLEQADPGYEWMFSHGLAGMITAYGGANSHMAIRAAELNLPACFGVGKTVFDALQAEAAIRLNCETKQMHPLPAR